MKKLKLKKLNFKQQKFLEISSALVLGSVVIGGIAGYIENKPQQGKIGQYNNKSKIDYVSLSKQRLSQSNSDQLKKVVNADGSNMTSNNGRQIWQYGKAIFGIDENSPIDYSKPVNLSNDLILSDQLLARILEVSGYQMNKKVDYSSQDAITWVGQFLNQNLPSIPMNFGLVPIEIGQYDKNISALKLGFDNFENNFTYGASPTVDVISIFITTFKLWMAQHYSPNNTKVLADNKPDTLSEATRFTNVFNYALMGSGNVWFDNSDLAETHPNEGSINNYKIFVNYLFNNNDLSKSPIYQYMAQPKDVTKTTDDSEAFFSVLGKTIGEVKQLLNKYFQRFAISYLQNFKFALIEAYWKQIVKFPLQNLNSDSDNYQQFGARDTFNGRYQGYRKDVYSEFKTLFQDTDLAETVFEKLENDQANLLNYHQTQSGDENITSFDLSKKSYVKDPKYVYKAIYSPQNAGAISLFFGFPLGFTLTLPGFPFNPASFNAKTGVYDQNNPENGPYVKNKLDTNASVLLIPNIYTNPRSDFKVIDDTRLPTNAWRQYNVFADENGFGIPSSVIVKQSKEGLNGTFANNETSKKLTATDGNELEINSQKVLAYAEKSYAVNDRGMNFFVSQILPILNAFANQEINFFKQNPDKYNEKDYNPATNPDLRKYKLEEVMKSVYTTFNLQSRANLAYYYDKTKGNASDPSAYVSLNNSSLSLNNLGLTPAIKYNVNSLGNAYGYFEIASEFYQNISNYASSIPQYNLANTDEGIIHWKSIDQFYDALTFYFINLGGTRGFSFVSPYLSQSKTSVNTSLINNSLGLGAYPLTNNGNTYDWKFPEMNPLMLYGVREFLSFKNLISTTASLLSFNYDSQSDYFETKIIGATTEHSAVAKQDILDLSSGYWKFLSSLEFSKVSLFNAQGELTDFSKKFIATFENEALGYKNFFSGALHNEKLDDWVTMYGYYDDNNKLNNIKNNFTQEQMNFFAFKPEIKWVNSVANINNSNYVNTDLSKKVGWVVPGLSFGAFTDSSLRSNTNSENIRNYLDFQFNAPFSDLANLSSVREVNGAAPLFSALTFDYDDQKHEIFIDVKKNYVLPEG